MGTSENRKDIDLDDLEWNNMGNFLENLVMTNESEEDAPAGNNDNANSSEHKAAVTVESESQVKKIKIQNHVRRSARLENPHTDKSRKSSGIFGGLQTDIKILFDELQEIKKARLEIQNRLNSLSL